MIRVVEGQQGIGAWSGRALSAPLPDAEAAMMAYRMYFLNGDDGRIVDFIEHLCADDPSALDRARALAKDSAVEIWQSKRRVALVTQGRDPILFGNGRLD